MPRNPKGRACLTCEHPQLQVIDAELARGMPVKRLARRPGMPSRWSIQRHKDSGHINPANVAAHAKSLVAENRDLREVELEERTGWLNNLRHQRVVLLEIQDALRRDGNLFHAAQVAGYITKNMMLAAQYLGELKSVSRTTVEHVLLADPAYGELRAGLLQLWRKHPAIRRDLDELLSRVEGAYPPAMGALPPHPPVLEHHVAAGR